MSEATVTGIFTYPVKSFGGFSSASVQVEARGLRHDRRWMLIDAEGVFMTQRSTPRLALFRTSIDSSGLRIELGEEHILVPFEPRGVVREVRVWRDTCRAIQVSVDVDKWISGILAQACTLVYMPDDSVRSTNPEFSKQGDMVGFADGYPVLIIGESSLADLNSRLDSPVPLNRFRGNIIVRGWEAFQEDTFEEIRIGNVILRAAKQCGRCNVTTTDQATAEVGVEPLRTLASYRLTGKTVAFGAYFIPVTLGAIHLGETAIGFPTTRGSLESG